MLISLGGWTLSKWFSDAALTPDSRRTLVESCIDLFIKGNLPGLAAGAGAGVFDGIDLDWEWPGSEGNVGNVIRAEDKQNFTALVAEFRRQLDEYGDGYELTTFLPAAPAKIDAGFEVDEIFETSTSRGPRLRLPRHVGAHDQSPGPAVLATPPPRSGALQPRPGDRQLPASGAPADKLVVGVPYLVAAGPVCRRQQGPLPDLERTGTGDVGGRSRGLRGAGNKPGRHHHDLLNGAHWFYDGMEWWSYDDPLTVARKMLYVRLNDSEERWCGRSTPTIQRGTLTATIDLMLR